MNSNPYKSNFTISIHINYYFTIINYLYVRIYLFLFSYYYWAPYTLNSYKNSFLDKNKTGYLFKDYFKEKLISWKNYLIFGSYSIYPVNICSIIS